MKQILKFLSLALLVLTLQNCSEEDNVNLKKEKVQFTLDVNALEVTAARIRPTDTPPGSSLFISVKKSTGESMPFQQLELLHLGGGLITASVELFPGSYKLTDFSIANADGAILYATPRKGSRLARFVIKPLDVSFSVLRDRVTNITMGVIDVSQSSPEDFGYTSFHINIVHPLHVSVFVPKPRGLSLASAKAYILQGDDTLQHFNLGACVNLLAFKQEIDEPYTLLISKNGFASYRREFIYTDLITELAGRPLKVTLTPAFTLLAYINIEQISDLFSISLNGIPGGNININWGDGTNDNYTFGSDGYTDNITQHAYSASRNYYVSITGDLNTVTSFYSFYGFGMIDEINLEQLTELKEIIFGLTRSPRIIDLSQNTKLEFVNMPNVVNTEIIDLPANNNINWISIDGPNQFTTASVSAMINDVYLSAIRDNRRNGHFELRESWRPPYGGMVGPPTPAALAKLVTLRDTYGWYIIPDL